MVLGIIALSLDKEFQPLVQTTKSSVKDSTHLLNIVNTLTPPQHTIILSSFHVTSCTLLSHMNWVWRQSDTFLAKFRTTFDWSLRNFLHQNNVLFGDQYYIQQWGTAMGSNVAPTSTNLQYIRHWGNVCLYEVIVSKVCYIYVI